MPRIRRLFGDESPAEFALFAAVFAAFVLLDRLTRSIASLDAADVDSSVLVWRALVGNPGSAIALVATTGAALSGRRTELGARWSTLGHGRDLQMLVAPLIVLLVWRGASYGYNYATGQWYVVDRLLLVGFGAASLVRPAWIVLLVLQLRVINQQLFIPTGAASTQNMSDLIVMAVLAVAAGHLLFVVLRRSSTSAVLAVIGTAIASHFFVPGRGKLSLGWLESDNVANLLLSSHTVGWLGSSDHADRAADLAHRLNTPAKLATLVIELGAVVAVAHPGLFQVWLLGAIAVHLIAFAMTGFWFADWIVLEAGLVWMLTRESTRQWVARSWTPLRAVLAVAVVGVAGGRVFHPPNLAWLDSPVSYAYRVEAIDDAGHRITLPPAVLAPFEQDLNFMYLEFAPVRPAAFGYGAVYSTDEIRQLEDVDDFDELAVYEQSLDVVDPEARIRSELLLIQALERWRSGPEMPAWLIAPPPRFWTQQEGIQHLSPSAVASVEVVRVTSLHAHPDLGVRRERLLRLAFDDEAGAEVVWRASSTD